MRLSWYGDLSCRSLRLVLKRRFIAFALSSLILGAVVAGCSDESGEGWTANGKALDRKVLSLGQGTSIEAVRSELGTPGSEFIEGREASLQYDLWQFVFVDGRLKRRVKEHLLEHGSVPPFTKASERRSKELDGEILELQRWMSIKAVKSRLGMPERFYETFESSRTPEVTLWYESWELSFVDGVLVMRTKS